jgi:hypothetical protein
VRSHSGRENGELPERKTVSVRTHTGDYAYEVTKELYARTEAVVHWDYMVYKVTPTEVLPRRRFTESGTRRAQRPSDHCTVHRTRSNGDHAGLYGGGTTTPPLVEFKTRVLRLKF